MPRSDDPGIVIQIERKWLRPNGPLLLLNDFLNLGEEFSDHPGQLGDEILRGFHGVDAVFLARVDN